MIREVHYVTFLSPGTFFSEQSSKPISAWDCKEAVALSEGVKERYGAKPYGFYFSTMRQSDPISDGHGGLLKVEPKEIAKSPIYFLGGKTLTIDDVRRRAHPEERILLSNMECNHEAVIVENRNSYRFTTFFTEDHCIVGPSGEIVRRGNDADLMEVRKRLKEEAA